MILPILGYGHPTLRKIASPIEVNSPIEELITNMYDTMYHANGVGLAAPQVGLSIRVIITDADPFHEQYPEAKGFKQVFINPEIIETSDETWRFSEGCLSVPDVNEEVIRPAEIRLHYYDEHFQAHDEWFSGIRARIIQHEYDHLEGKVFVDYLSNLKRTLLKRKLNDIFTGKNKVAYRFVAAKNKK